MRLLATALRCLATLFALLPMRDRVVLLSRQSSTMSLDYRLLYERLLTRLPAHRVVVCLSEPETKGFFAFAWNMLKQLFYASTSRVCIVDGYNPVVCIPRIKGRYVIQAWHALGAVKKFSFQSLDTPSGRSSADAEAACMHRNYDVVICGGPGCREVFSEAFGYPVEQTLPIGMPRFDYLLEAKDEVIAAERVRELRDRYPFLDNGKPNVVYAPTFRKGIDDENWLTGYLSALAQALEGENVNLVIVGHPLDAGFDESLLEEYAHLHCITGVATMDVLALMDAVITDYSAVAFEAALMEKRVYFYVPDIEEYRLSPGLNIDPIVEFPACSALDATELVEKMAFHDEQAAHESTREFRSFIDRFFEGVEYGATDRLVDVVCAQLKEVAPRTVS